MSPAWNPDFFSCCKNGPRWKAFRKKFLDQIQPLFRLTGFKRSYTSNVSCTFYIREQKLAMLHMYLMGEEFYHAMRWKTDVPVCVCNQRAVTTKLARRSKHDLYLKFSRRITWVGILSRSINNRHRLKRQSMTLTFTSYVVSYLSNQERQFSRSVESKQRRVRVCMYLVNKG